MKRAVWLGVGLSLVVVAVAVPAVVRNCSNITDKHFLSPQERVAKARELKDSSIRAQIKNLDVPYPPGELYLRAFKQERILEIWVGKLDQPLKLFRTYPIAGMSGTLGPKRKEGDQQVPEGFYQIDRFNPASKFHLSLGLNYPNESDRIRSDRKKPGSDIFIHGDTRSIGCLAMTDELIREIYLIALDFRTSRKAPIPVHIFPFRMTPRASRAFAETFPQHARLWAELQPAFQNFEVRRLVPKVRVESDGRYTLVPSSERARMKGIYADRPHRGSYPPRGRAGADL